MVHLDRNGHMAAIIMGKSVGECPQERQGGDDDEMRFAAHKVLGLWSDVYCSYSGRAVKFFFFFF